MMDTLDKLTANIGDMALKRRVRTIISRLGLSFEDRVLDCGCGDGLYLKTISGLVKCAIVGFDLNRDSLELAYGFIRGSHIPLVQGNICSLPFKNDSFDKIFSSEVLEHVPDDLCALRNIYKVLKVGGKLIITVPNHKYPFLWDPLNWLLERISGKHVKSGFWAGIWNMHLRLYSAEEIEAQVEKAGFKVRSVEFLTHYCLPFNHVILYAMKQLLNSGVLPEAMRNTADKFRPSEEKQSKAIKFGYRVMNMIDKLNDLFPNYKSSVSICLEAVKE